MTITKISDVIVPELFEPYVTKRTAEKSAIFQSGIITADAHFSALASEAARTHNMPFFNDLTGDPEEVLESTTTAPDKITSNKDVSTTIMLRKSWGATNLSAALAGTDPMAAIADLVASYWARTYQKVLIKTLDGVFGTYTPEGGSATTPMADHILDLSAMSSASAKIISASAFIDACQLLGDAQDNLTAVVMHSATKSYLKKQNLIATERDSTDVEFDTYQGRRVIVDDGCPIVGGVHTTYLFGQGAVAFGEGKPVGFITTETDRDKMKGAGEDFLITRRAFIMHPRGIKWTDAVRENAETPLLSEIANAQNWKPVYEPKQLRIVAIKHKIG